MNEEFNCQEDTRESPAHNIFRSTYFTPTFSKYNNTIVAGAQWFNTIPRCNISQGIDTYPPSYFYQASVILLAAKELSIPPENFQWDGSWFGHPGSQLIDMYAGTPLFREMIDAGMSAWHIHRAFQRDVMEFQITRQSILLYE